MSDTRKQDGADNGVGSTGCSASDFLTAEQIPIGSWWKIAQGGEYGYCVTAVDVARREATVLSTKGEVREIDTFKLQCRYSRVLPNTQGLVTPGTGLSAENAPASRRHQ